MKEQFVTYEIALKLKELGFNKPCMGLYYCKDKEFSFYGQNHLLEVVAEANATIIPAPLWQQVIDWCDSKELLVGTIIVGNQYKSTINKINYETELFNSRNESIERAIEFAISYLQNHK